jgi:environmental stress-induced protein Ves
MLGHAGAMPSTRLIRFTDLESTRWANGAGRTTEIARDRPGAEFVWRLSIAVIDSDAPFSVLPGLDRFLTPLDGPLVLAVAGVPRPLGPQEVFVFPGEAEVASVGVDRPSRDLNLMVRRTRATGSLEVRHVDAETRLASSAAGAGSEVTSVVVALSEGVDVDGALLGPGDAVVSIGTPVDVGPGVSGRALIAVARIAVQSAS